MNILRKLLAAAVSLGQTPSERRAIHQTLMADQKALARSALRIKANEARKRRLAAHANGCIQGYRAKIEMVRLGKGKNSVTGIPDWMLEAK